MDIYIIISLITLVLIGIVLNLFFMIMQAISSVWGFFSIIAGPLVGAFVGVLLGFKLNDNHRKRLDHERRLFFKNLLLNEVKKSIELLGGAVNVIPLDAWNSLVNSGDIALFKDKAIKLSDIYFKIQVYNYEAKRVRDAIEHESTWGIAVEDETGKPYSRASDLKGKFNGKTKPELLKDLMELEKLICSI